MKEFTPTEAERPEFEWLTSNMKEIIEKEGLFGHVAFTLKSGRKVMFRMDHSKTVGTNNSHTLASIEEYAE